MEAWKSYFEVISLVSLEESKALGALSLGAFFMAGGEGALVDIKATGSYD